MRSCNESYLHKIAKELLYTEIERKGRFDWKTECSSGSNSLTKREDYRKECILMEFPTGNDECNGLYPDEINICKLRLECTYSCHEGRFCRLGLDTCALRDKVKTKPCFAKGYRFNNGSGYCSCSQCEYIDLSKVIIHDIAIFSKGHIEFAIEIVNKHSPDWIDRTKVCYPVYVIHAENILKRVSDTSVFVTKIL